MEHDYEQNQYSPTCKNCEQCDCYRGQLYDICFNDDGMNNTCKICCEKFGITPNSITHFRSLSRTENCCKCGGKLSCVEEDQEYYVEPKETVKCSSFRWLWTCAVDSDFYFDWFKEHRSLVMNILSDLPLVLVQLMLNYLSSFTEIPCLKNYSAKLTSNFFRKRKT